MSKKSAHVFFLSMPQDMLTDNLVKYCVLVGTYTCKEISEFLDRENLCKFEKIHDRLKIMIDSKNWDEIKSYLDIIDNDDKTYIIRFGKIIENQIANQITNQINKKSIRWYQDQIQWNKKYVNTEIDNVDIKFDIEQLSPLYKNEII